MAVSLLSASPEVLRAIVLLAVDALGPPHEWNSLVRSCKTLRRRLDTPAMHTLLFANAFHVPADVLPLLPAHAKAELKRRFLALKYFRRGRAQCFDDSGTFTDALWVAYIMLRAEEPRQMNVDQLLWAGLPGLLLLYIQQRLNDGAKDNHGWPLCNETNSLVITLMWLLSSEGSVRAESTATLSYVLAALAPFALAAFRYPLSNLPGDYFGSTSVDSTPSKLTRHASPPTRQVEYFGTRTVQVPSAPIYSILCYFTRLDALSPMFPAHLSSAAQSPSKFGPRREDVEHFINECRTRFEPWDLPLEYPGSSIADPLTRCLSPSYFPGLLTGRWQGSSIVPSINDYRHWRTDPEAPETMEMFCRQPMYLTLQEYVCHRTETGEACAKEDEAWWLPASWVEKDGGIEVSDESNSCNTFYSKLDNTNIARLEDVADVLVTGQTDDPYASAWGAFKIFGRVRLSDGLVVLRRESAGMGTTLLRGYMTSPRNFAGRYRAIRKGYTIAEWEAAFSLCKTDTKA
ncbi:hypothetical protein B0H16DRAFT_698707 [Mycena metata]|uniref:F-box domain-containing protein n=1 Tax=Mycena metata TaxID=1033252 RepID=A0AAD7J438_9AGAR|nr:hypothetical protein B0H16DRAFT_698707 [Mycena metata]